MLSLARQLSRSALQKRTRSTCCVSTRVVASRSVAATGVGIDHSRQFTSSPVRAASSSSSSGEDQQQDVSNSRYAVVDHSKAYEEAMRGLHGKQLQLAYLEGSGKDDEPFDPFLEEEMEEEEEKKRAESSAAKEPEEDNDAEGEEEDVDSEQDEYDSEEEEDHDEEDDDKTSLYNRDGSLRWKKSQLIAFRAGAPAGGMFAIIDLKGSQHKVTVDDLLVINLLTPVEKYKVGSVHTLTDIMLVGSSHMTMVGMPHVSGAEVDVMVEEITQDSKVIVFKKKRRKGYKRKKGHRRDLTLLRILDIRPPKEFGNHDHVKRQNPIPTS